VREDRLDSVVKELLATVAFSEKELLWLRQELTRFNQTATQNVETTLAALERDLGSYKSRLAMLTRAYADGDVERDIYLETKESLLASRARSQDRLEQLHADPEAIYDRALRALELAATALQSFESGNASQKRRILQAVSSNRTLSGSEPSVELAFPFAGMANSACVQRLRIDQDTVRTLRRKRRTRSSLSSILRSVLVWVRVQRTAERAGQQPHPAYARIGEWDSPPLDEAA
jgi:hypothetical protein